MNRPIRKEARINTQASRVKSGKALICQAGARGVGLFQNVALRILAHVQQDLMDRAISCSERCDRELARSSTMDMAKGVFFYHPLTARPLGFRRVKWDRPGRATE